jgi:hypothetical protein
MIISYHKHTLLLDPSFLKSNEYSPFYFCFSVGSILVQGPCRTLVLKFSSHVISLHLCRAMREDIQYMSMLHVRSLNMSVLYLLTEKFTVIR